LILNSSFLY